MKLPTLLLVSSLTILTINTSCSEKRTGKARNATPVATPVALESYILQQEPAPAIDITDMRKTATPGAPVTFVGKIIGSDNVFMDGRAVMIVGDPNQLTSCDLKPGDNCATPWDVCCDDPDTIKANIVTVQVVDAAGKPLKTTLKGLGGLKELSKVTITGTVAKESNKDNMLINATGIFVQ